MNDNEINDKRDIKEFRFISFSGFKKGEVLKQYSNSILQNNVESSCYWCAELLCSGHIIDIWNLILDIYSKNITAKNITFTFLSFIN